MTPKERALAAFESCGHNAKICLSCTGNAIRDAQAEQRRKDADLARRTWKEISPHFHAPHTICREIADAIAQGDE